MRQARWTVVASGALLLASLITGSSQTAASTVTSFSDVKESCTKDEGPPGTDPTCGDIVGEVTLTPVDGGMAVTWTKGSDDFVIWWNCANPPNGGTGYGPLGNCYVISQQVYASFDPQSGTGGQTCVPKTLEARSCTITGLRNGVQYSFRIRSEVSGMPGRRDFTYTPFTSETASPCCSLPLPPSDVMAVPVGGALDVSWAQPADWGGATELRYLVSTVPASSSCEATALACRLENVPRGVPLTVQVSATNGAGASAVAESAPVSVAVTVPDAPGRVRATYPKPGTARVTWTTPANDGGRAITSYIATASPGGRTCTSTGARSCSITGLAGGVAYSFTVRARSTVGASPVSPPGVAGVLINPASAPRSPVGTVTGSSVQVSWKRPAESGGGRLIKYVARAGAYSCATQRTSCTIGGLALGRTYSVSVVAVTSGGQSKPALTQVTTSAPQGTPPTPSPDPKAPAPIS